MPVVIPPVLASLPRPVTPDDLLAFGRLITVVDTDGPHTSAPGPLASLLIKCNKPVYETNGGFPGRVTQIAIQNWTSPTLSNGLPNPNATLPPPIRPGDMNCAIIGQCSMAGCWAPDNATTNPTLQADSTRTDHPIFWISPLGKNNNIPDTAASPYGQLAIKGNSGSPWPYIQLLCYGMAAMDQTILPRWKAAGVLWNNVLQLFLPVFNAAGLSADNLNWWAPLTGDQVTALMPKVCLAGNQYKDGQPMPTAFDLFWAANGAAYPGVTQAQAQAIWGREPTGEVSLSPSNPASPNELDRGADQQS